MNGGDRSGIADAYYRRAVRAFSSFPRLKLYCGNFFPLPDPVRQFQPEVHSETVGPEPLLFQQYRAFLVERLTTVFLRLSGNLKEAVMPATAEYELTITTWDHVRTSAPDRQRT